MACRMVPASGWDGQHPSAQTPGGSAALGCHMSLSRVGRRTYTRIHARCIDRPSHTLRCLDHSLTSLPPHLPAVLERYRALAQALDSRFRLPGTPVRFGWDALIGLVPGLGDAAGGLLGAYGLWTAHQLGAPMLVLLRMLLNLTIDLGVGTLPLLGDLFDVVWKGNQRNLVLLERWLEEPHETRRRSGRLLAAILAVLLLLILAAGYVALWLVRGLLSAR